MNINEKLNTIITFLYILLIMVGIILGVFVSALLNESNIQDELQQENLNYTLI